MKSPITIKLLFLFTVGLHSTADARYEWIELYNGKFQGAGFSRDRYVARDRCVADTQALFIKRAQQCCETTVKGLGARFANRCSSNYRGKKFNRSFESDLPAYFCYPGKFKEMATGYWEVKSEIREYACTELRDLSSPTPSPTPTPAPDYRCSPPLYWGCINTPEVRCGCLSR